MQYDSFSITIDQATIEDPEKMSQLTELFVKVQDAMVAEIENIQQQLGVSQECAAKVLYLRTRSRWTQEKEDQLVSWDKAGQPLPLVTNGDF